MTTAIATVLPADAGGRTAEQVGNEITELCAYLYAGTYRLLVLIREFDENNYWHQPGLCSCAHWLNLKCGIGMNAAREKVRVARALKALPKISAAFERGELSYSKARAMTRVANEHNEDYLLMIAKHGTAWHMETLIAKYRRASRNMEAAMAMEQHDRRECEFYFDHDDSLVIKARFPADQGATVLRAIEHAVEQQYRDGDNPAAAGIQDVSAETPEPDPLPVRRADALAGIAETYLASDSIAAATADRYQVVVHVAANTLQGDDGSAETSPLGNADIAYLEHGPHVSAETSRRLACDASLVKLVEDEEGEPLSIGRRSRAIPPAMRRALNARDGGCRFPGCTRKRYVDGHHIKHWANGGETSLDNLVQLCRHHHRLVHEGGYRCDKAPDNKIVFHAPSGEQLHTRQQVRAIAKHTDVLRWFDRYMPDLDIDADTCTAKWYAGDRMDWDLAVAHMFQ